MIHYDYDQVKQLPKGVTTIKQLKGEYKLSKQSGDKYTANGLDVTFPDGTIAMLRGVIIKWDENECEPNTGELFNNEVIKEAILAIEYSYRCYRDYHDVLKRYSGVLSDDDPMIISHVIDPDGFFLLYHDDGLKKV